MPTDDLYMLMDLEKTRVKNVEQNNYALKKIL